MIIRFAVLLAFGLIAVASDVKAQSQTSTIGYASVEEARKALLAKPSIQAREQQGWLIVEDPAEMTIWSFTPRGHEAYPAAVKRTVLLRDDGIYVDMKALCQAEKTPCDRLIEEFRKLTTV